MRCRISLLMFLIVLNLVCLIDFLVFGIVELVLDIRNMFLILKCGFISFNNNK